ncbi:MAG: phosphodiester glycosidase family protein [Aquaticitalea sp.]
MKPVIILLLFFSTMFCSCQESLPTLDDEKFVNYIVDPQNQDLKFFWKDQNDSNYGNFQTLKSELKKEKKELAFAVNGGMFNKNHSPQGLYIEDGELLAKLDTLSGGYGNFYLQPNGVFYLTDAMNPVICTTKDFDASQNISYATQSGPMLVIDSKIHPKFREGSENMHIRNGVGILPDGKLLFAMSKKIINFYDFASYFKVNGCENALYLDGFVSRTYLPEKEWEQNGSDFGVIIAVIKDIE